ncbi:MAG: hypothetical protein ACK5RG_13540 [Cyclobacteriaceae bacterium]|jgi:hypothetical protein|nr:hypothetical protein [Flammeovirgaceae bacterium]
MKPEGDVIQNMTTLSESINNAIEIGYNENFKMKGIRLMSDNGLSTYAPDDICINNFFRFEGYSNTDDSSILYLIETHDGRKGTLVDSYGVYANGIYSEFIRQVLDIRKKKELV